MRGLWTQLPAVALIAALLTGAGCDDKPPVVGPGGSSAATTSSAGPQVGDLTSFRKVVTMDSHNDAVSDEERANPKPVHGGEVRIRTGTLPPGLNRHIQSQNTAGAAEIDTYVYSELLRQHPETLELQPLAARYWTTEDVLDLKDGDKAKRIYGVVASSEAGKQVVFLEGAKRVTLALFETEGAPELKIGASAEGEVKLKGGATFKGTVKRIGDFTIEVTDTTDAKERTVAWKDLVEGSWKLGEGDSAKPQTGPRPYCRILFQLRDGIKWHDGKPLTAADYEFTYHDVVLNKHVKAQQVRAVYQDLESVRAVGKLGVRFEWTKPFFQAVENSGAFQVVAKHRFWKPAYKGDPKQFGDDYDRHADNRHPIGFGPYRFKKWDGQISIALERNKDWFGSKVKFPYLSAGSPYLDRLVWVNIGNKVAALNAMRQGDIDVDTGVEPSTWADPQTQDPKFTAKFVRVLTRNPGYTYIGWNMRYPMFKDKRVRQALTMLLNRAKIADDIHKGVAEPVSGPFFPGSPANDDSIKPWPYDPEKAKELLDDAGFGDRDGDRMLEFRPTPNDDPVPFAFKYYHHTAREYHTRIAVKVQEAMKAAGIAVELQSLDWPIFIKEVDSRKPHAFRFARTAGIDPDPYPIWHSSQIEDGSNVVAYRNARVDEICEQVRITFDRNKRWALIRELHRILHDEQPYTFMFLFKGMNFYNKDLRGVKFYTTRYQPIDYTEWWRVSK